jgi:hypothetical protein
MSLIPTADYASLSSEALTPRLVLVPAQCPEHREVPSQDPDLEDRFEHVGGCLRGVFFAIAFETAAVALCFLVFRAWRMVR